MRLLGNRLAMWEAFDTVALLWTAIILAYGVIALALIVGRWTLNQIRRHVFEHYSSLPHPAHPR
jgi:hypothetical protein